jgi:hypothetical protein
MVADHSPEQDFQASMAFYLSSRLSASASHTFHKRSRKSTKWTSKRPADVSCTVAIAISAASLYG